MEFPRHVHQADGLHKTVEDDASYDQALKEGWSAHPPVVLYKGAKTKTVKTRGDLDAALADGWSSTPAEPKA